MERSLEKLPMRLSLFFYLTGLYTSIFAQPVLKIGGFAPKDIFIGIDNPVTLDSAGITEAYELSMEGSTILSTGRNRWSIRATNPGAYQLLLRNAPGTVLKKIPVTVKRIDEPRIWLNTRDGLLPFKATFPRSVVAELQGLAMTIDIPWLRNGFQINGFSIALERRQETIAEEQIRGNIFPASIRERFKTIQTGEKIYINDIRCQGIGDCSCTRALQGFVITVN